MKRITCIILSLIFAIFALAGCARKEEDTVSYSTEKTDKPEKITDAKRYGDDDDDEPESNEEMKDNKDDKAEEDKEAGGEKKEVEEKEEKGAKEEKGEKGEKEEKGGKEEEEEKTEKNDGATANKPAKDDNNDSDRSKKKAENAAKRSINGTLKNFSATTLDGRRFTSADIAKYDMTVINFWGTYCGPCIAEMPDLAEFYNNLPEGVNFVTYCVDGSGNEDEAQSIIDDAGLDAIVILGASGDFANILGQIMYIPTTIFVNKHGEIVGYELIGRSEDLARAYKDRISDALAETDR